MCSFSFLRFACALVSFCVLVVAPAWGATNDDQGAAADANGAAKKWRPYADGQKLFDREWQRNDPLSGRGDGLGPMFNARSCAACHHQQGSGGGGDAKHDVDLLTLVGVKETAPPKSDFPRTNRTPRTILEQLHPGFKTANSVTLHAFGSRPEYEEYRAALMDPTRPANRSVQIFPSARIVTGKAKAPAGKTQPFSVTWTATGGSPVIEIGPFTLKHSRRNTPSLFGSGLIDSISDQALRELAAESSAGSVGQGSAAQTRRVFSGASGRFGWKGQAPTLKAFVAGACANELGLQTKGNVQGFDPTDPTYRREYVDMSAADLDKMTAYIGSLPPPKRREPANEQEAAALTRGALLFGQARCQTWHVQDVENVRGIYSDLQLHDMGQKLSDPTGPALSLSVPLGGLIPPVSPKDYEDPEKVADPSISTGSRPYYGHAVIDLASMWRTPPLWGVRYSAPYLHDGRAATLEAAIEQHDGEASSSAVLFREMTATQRRDLVFFVSSLGTP